MEDSQPLTTASVARALQQLRLAPDANASRRDPRVSPYIARFFTRSTPETCQFRSQKDMRGCREPRSCRDCLLHDGSGCMVSGFTCTSADLYLPALDYKRVGINDNGFSVLNASATTLGDGACFNSRYYNALFPANTTGYCSASDPACTKCRMDKEAAGIYSEVQDRVDYYYESKTFCLGADGCVCVSGCEDPLAFPDVAERSHCRFASSRRGSASYMTAATPILGLVLSILMAFIWKKEAWRRLTRADRDGEAPTNTSHSTTTAVRGLRRYMLDVAPALHLDLYGWRHFQNEILRKERELLSGTAGDVSPVARPMAFEFALIPTAPDFDEQEESTAPTITNPHALASAPLFRLEAPIFGGNDDGMPSAPDYE